MLFSFTPFAVQARTRNVNLNETFERAAKDFNVPRDLLVAIAFVETRFNDRRGVASKDGGFGMMHLVDNPDVQTLTTAARAIEKPKDTLKTDIEQNIRGGAALLSSYADQQGLAGESRQDLAEWYLPVARYSNAESDEVASLYGDEVFKVLTTGLSFETKKGETITIAPHAIEPKKGKYGNVVITRSTDLPATRGLTPVMKIANPRNFSTAQRAKDYPIRYIVIHTTQGSYAGTISWFQNPKAHVSAHYVVRSADGTLAQVVLDKDLAWHAGNRKYNQQAIGIEHEGFVDDASWYTDAMYKSSAALTRALCTKYGIPMDRAHIVGHYEIRPQKNKHTDPGRLWNWDKYMREVNPEAFKSRGIRKKKSSTRSVPSTNSAKPAAQKN
jgi:N-acetyl-anhydromuramyl-L-alanine amidase AmpD